MKNTFYLRIILFSHSFEFIFESETVLVVCKLWDRVPWSLGNILMVIGIGGHLQYKYCVE